VLAVGHSEAATAKGVAEQLHAELGADHRVVLYFASTRYEPRELAIELASRFPDALVAGCSTMGELGPKGLTTDSVSAVGLAAPCRAVAQVIEDTRGFQFADGVALCAAMAADLDTSQLDPEKHVLVTLTDGLSGAEELVVAALGLAAPQVGLVGGSAADDLHLEQTWVALDGRVFPSASLVLVLEPQQPFTAFAVHHFDATERRVVVTRADPDRRVVHALDGLPAAEVMAELLDVTRAALLERPLLPSERDVSFAYAIGERMFMRSVIAVEGDSLVMRGAVEEGVVLRVMRGGDLVERTRSGFGEALHATAAGALVFNCGGRLLEARARGVEAALYDAMSAVPVAGFSTYGEQFGPLLVNHTLTGLAIG
jgi:hypothetical protein